MNFEFSYNTHYWDESQFTSEIRPIVGWHLGKVDVIFNPILDNSFKGAANLHFAPESRIAYNLNSKWAVAFEEYDDFGPVKHFDPGDERIHEAFNVFDYSGRSFSLEGGVGVWGQVPMPPNKALVSEEEANTLVTWILSL